MRNKETSDAPCWYAVYTHPRQENRADSNLRAWQVETFYPKVKQYRYNQYNHKPICLSSPLFPRYIFARFVARYLLHKVSFTRGVQSVVSFDGQPVPVADEIIKIIKANIREDGFVRVHEDLKTGDEVIINNGRFKNLKGIFEREMKGSDRVIILLTAINYQGRISIERELVKKAINPAPVPDR